MTRNTTKRPVWTCPSGAAPRPLALVLVLAILALVLFQGGVKAAGTFNPVVDVELSNYTCRVNADVTTSFSLPGTDYNYKELVSFTPGEFFVAAESDAPIGAEVGELDHLLTVGLINGACNTPLSPSFTLLNCSTDTGDTVSFDEQFDDVDPANGIHDGCDRYPDFLKRILPGITPRARLYGDTTISGRLVSINVVLLEPGSLGYPVAWGYPSVTVFNDIGDPAVPTPGEAISDFCTPRSEDSVIYGLSEDDPETGDDEAGYEVRRNPPYGGTYTFRWYAESYRDADGDGIENPLDTCPFDDNVDPSPKVLPGHPDEDGIDSACDPDPAVSCWPGAPGLLIDCDGDGFYNRGDNCPMLANPDQADADADDIGDACDLVGAGGIGQGPDTPDGDPIVVALGVDVPICGPSPGPSFNPSLECDVSDHSPDANADVMIDFAIPAGDVNFEALVTFTPPEFWVAADVDVPDGAHVSDLDSLSTLGLLNNVCITALPVSFTMLDCTTNTADTVSFEDGFADLNGNGLPDACDEYPDFLNTMFPGITPRARYYGQTSVAGTPVAMNFGIFEPGTALPGLPPFDPGLGYPSVAVLNDPTAPPAPGSITDFCTPLGTNYTIFGISRDNPSTVPNEAGAAVRRNPALAGDYVYSAYARSLRDADGDGIENDLDTCPFDVNEGDPRVAGSGDNDNDGIDNVCDPTPDEANTDVDGDVYLNRGDNCPLVANPDQADADADDIGDACDLVGAGGIGQGPDTPDGDPIVVTVEEHVDISGPSPPTPTPSPTPTLTPTPTATPTLTPTATPTPTGQAEYCSPVFPGTYNGLVRIDGQPAASGYQVTASIDSVQWGSAIVSGGRYALDIPDHMPTVAPCFEGGTITFALDGMTCTPTADWASGIHDVDLACAPVAPPVAPPITPASPVTPTPTVPATPTVTAVKPPLSGAGGLSGSSPGLPLWTTALASWAGLMIMVSLGTLVAARQR